MPAPEALARENIDAQLAATGWTVQDRAGMNLYAARGVALGEFPLETSCADYLLFEKNIIPGVLQKVLVALPPLEEQRRIVAEVERRLESARAVEAAVEAGVKRAGRLRHVSPSGEAVLRAAFEIRL